MDWLRVNRNLPAHPKSKALARGLGEPVSWWRIAQVWAWCLEYARDGRIEGDGATIDIEDAAGWPEARRGEFVDVCVRIGFLEKGERGYVVHDWDEHNGAAIKHAEKAAARSRKWRKNKQKERERANEKRTHTVREPSAHSIGNQTRPNQTRPDEKQIETVEPAGAGPESQVYARWRELYCQRASPQPTEKRRKLIRARLAERRPDTALRDVLDSLEGWRFDPWQGRRDQVDLEILLRDAAHVDKGLSLLPPPPSPPKYEKEPEVPF